VLNLYPGLADDLSAFSPLPAGLHNRNARLTAGGRDLVLKLLPAGRPAARSVYALTLQAQLAAAGFPCPEVLANTDGALVTHCDGETWTLQGWADGVHLAGPERPAYLDAGGARTLGETMGRLHRLAGTAVLPAGDTAADLPRLLAGSLEAARAFLGQGGLRPSPARILRFKPGKSDLEQEILRWAESLQVAITWLSSWKPPAELNAAGPGHGDINWENLLFSEAGGVTVLDFDNAGLMPVAYDAGAACAVICGAGKARQENFASGYNAAGGAAFPSEHLPYLVLLKYTRSLAWQIRGRGECADPDLARSWVAFLGENLARTLSDLES